MEEVIGKALMKILRESAADYKIVEVWPPRPAPAPNAYSEAPQSPLAVQLVKISVLHAQGGEAAAPLDHYALPPNGCTDKGVTHAAVLVQPKESCDPSSEVTSWQDACPLSLEEAQRLMEVTDAYLNGPSDRRHFQSQSGLEIDFPERTLADIRGSKPYPPPKVHMPGNQSCNFSGNVWSGLYALSDALKETLTECSTQTKGSTK